MKNSQSQQSSRGSRQSQGQQSAGLFDFGAQIENMIMDNIQGWVRNLADVDFNDLRKNAGRYAKQYPVGTIVAGSLIGAAIGLALVKGLASTASTRH